LYIISHLIHKNVGPTLEEEDFFAGCWAGKANKKVRFFNTLLFRYTLMAEFCGEAGRKYAFISSWVWLVCGLVGTDLQFLFLGLLAWKK
jgi:hypothetical protein